MKNRQKSRSGCRTCKLRRLRCDETKPGCRNCAQKGFECPGYQQRLQWSTKHERATPTRTGGPANFTQLVTAASESIAKTGPDPGQDDGSRAPAMVPVPAGVLTVPAIALSASASPSSRSCSCSASSTPSPSPQVEELVVSVEPHGALVPTVIPKSDPGLPVNEANAQTLQLPMLQPVVDIPTFLIEHWFKSVCTSWSALDSPANPYRRLTANLWHTSTPVFYALQAISAASLVERLPHVMQETAKSAPRRATEAINKELLAFSAGPRTKFPTELLLALFCMSSSMCWTESHQLGQQFVRQARAVLRSLEGWTLDSETQELLDFFNGCLVYEEMLRSVVSDDDIDFENMLSWPEPKTQHPVIPAVGHPWSGVSSDVLRLFGKAMALSRRSRIRWRHNDGTSYRILQRAMEDIEEATKVEGALLAVPVPQLPVSSDVSQLTNRLRDLHYITEAYRLSSLLQLYETFPDVILKRTPTLKGADGPIIWHTWVSPIALHITDVLGKVPAGSLSCIQPLLCLCAGSGLRYDSVVPLGRGHQSHLLSVESDAPTLPVTAAPNPDVPGLSPTISETAIKTSQARHILMTRLDQLELNLPPKPIGVAKQLLRAVWSAYDEEIALTRRTHWLDVMSYTGLHSIFG